MNRHFHYIPKDLIREEKVECVGDVKGPPPVPDFEYKQNMRKNQEWEIWENKLICEEKYTLKQLASIFFRTPQAVKEQRWKLRKMETWRNDNKIKYMCTNCSMIMDKKGSCNCMSLEYKLIPPEK